MSFTRPQQPALRQYLAMAWAEHCRVENISVSARCAKSKRCGDAENCAYCAWYEGVLEQATGYRSTTDCNAGGDYEAFMRALEIIHGKSIVWQVKAAGGNVRRMEWLLGDALPGKAYSLEFIRGVARRALKRGDWPDLEQLTAAERATVLEALKAIGRKERDWEGNPAAEDVAEVEDPF